MPVTHHSRRRSVPLAPNPSPNPNGPLSTMLKRLMMMMPPKPRHSRMRQLPHRVHRVPDPVIILTIIIITTAFRARPLAPRDLLLVLVLGLAVALGGAWPDSGGMRTGVGGRTTEIDPEIARLPRGLLGALVPRRPRVRR